MIFEKKDYCDTVKCETFYDDFYTVCEAFMALEMQITKLMLQRIMKEDPSSPHLQHCHIGIRNLERKKAASVPLILLRLS